MDFYIWQVFAAGLVSRFKMSFQCQYDPDLEIPCFSIEDQLIHLMFVSVF